MQTQCLSVKDWLHIDFCMFFSAQKSCAEGSQNRKNAAAKLCCFIRLSRTEENRYLQTFYFYILINCFENFQSGYGFLLGFLRFQDAFQYRSAQFFCRIDRLE